MRVMFAHLCEQRDVEAHEGATALSSSPQMDLPVQVHSLQSELENLRQREDASCQGKCSTRDASTGAAGYLTGAKMESASAEAAALRRENQDLQMQLQRSQRRAAEPEPVEGLVRTYMHLHALQHMHWGNMGSPELRWASSHAASPLTLHWITLIPMPAGRID